MLSDLNKKRRDLKNNFLTQTTCLELAFKRLKIFNTRKQITLSRSSTGSLGMQLTVLSQLENLTEVK